MESYLISKMHTIPWFVSRLHVQIMLTTETSMAAINIFTMLFYRFRKTMSCLSRATNILFGLDHYSQLPLSRFWILAIIACNFTTRLCVYVSSVFTVFTCSTVAVVAYVPYSVLGVVVVLNAIIETSYRDVNEQILRFGHQQQHNNVDNSHHQMLALWSSENTSRIQPGKVSILRDLMAKHYEIGDVTLDIYSCFKVDVFVTCSMCTTKIIMQTYIWYLHLIYTTNVFSFHFTLVTEIMFLVSMICITASSCENVTLQVSICCY